MLFRYRNEEARNIAAAAQKSRQQSMFNAYLGQRNAESYTDTATTGAVTFVPAPASASSPGTAGQMSADASFGYLCIGTDTWVRWAVATW